MAEGKCPECGSTRINQFRMPYGPIWCMDCGFRVEDKTAVPNPFLTAGKGTHASEAPPGTAKPASRLRAALHKLFRPE